MYVCARVQCVHVHTCSSNIRGTGGLGDWGTGCAGVVVVADAGEQPLVSEVR